jgi:hypothetical protein
MTSRSVYVLVKKKFVKFVNYIYDDYFPLKRQGARVKIRKQSWLKQLRVVISTWASVPNELSPQNS